MSTLEFTCTGADTRRFAAAPTIDLHTRITDSSGSGVHTIVLQCLVRIQPRRRRYSDAEAEGLRDVFGETGEWARTMQALTLANTSVIVPAFTGATDVDVPLPCSYDFEVAAAKYLHALGDGDVPLLVQFSGTVFRKAPQGFTVEQVPWDLEAEHPLPVAVWRRTMDHYFPAGGWIRAHRDTVDALQSFKSRNALPTWDDALMRLLDKAGEARDDL
ncbi:DUF6084 family protein [Streptomonospora litoralis]|uniref:Uncharacterized protein n=1 Tax=Streptomonospora litoralis TaxID=2498135 RepID=A0A4P6Q2T2_9ACTN|nr:DUF6084 family protein [Streptomonospora litoralis]QBI53551.1 hypothetical protein EKD16_08785 [Streptomonospora litoralis]